MTYALITTPSVVYNSVNRFATICVCAQFCHFESNIFLFFVRNKIMRLCLGMIELSFIIKQFFAFLYVLS